MVSHVANGQWTARHDIPITMRASLLHPPDYSGILSHEALNGAGGSNHSLAVVLTVLKGPV